MQLHIHLNKLEPSHQTRHKYAKCSDEEYEAYNQAIANSIPRDTTYQNYKTLLTPIALQHISKIITKPKQEYITEPTLDLIKQRRVLKENEQHAEADALNQTIKKAKKQYKTNAIIETLDKDLDIRDRWMVIRFF